MSVLVKDQSTGEYTLYSKGADEILGEKLN